MIKYVQRANEVLRVEDGAVDKYLANGYDLLDDTGSRVIRKGVKESYTLAEYKALQEENERLKAEIETLKAKKNA
jgi:cell shape-determining protein MreC